jgi:hypothetical protein
MRAYLEGNWFQGPKSAQIAAHCIRDAKGILSPSEVFAAHRQLAGERPAPINIRMSLDQGIRLRCGRRQNQSNAFNELVAFQKVIFGWVLTMECKELAGNVNQGLTSYDECEYTTRLRGIVFSEECLSSRRSTSSGDSLNPLVAHMQFRRSRAEIPKKGTFLCIGLSLVLRLLMP